MTGSAVHLRTRHRLRDVATIMAASAAMIVIGVPGCALAQAAPQRTPPATNGAALVNQMQALRAQMRQMQGQIEMLQHQLQQIEQSSKSQYLDLDSRIGKLEHAKPALASSAPTTSSPASASSVATTTAPQPATSASPSTTDQAAAKKAYAAAFKSLRDGNYVASAREFRAFTTRYPHSKLVSNAYYWLGESYYVTGNYKVALATFRGLLQKYPHSRKVPDAQLKIGYCQFEMQDYQGARRTLAAVAKAYPGTTVARLASNRLQSIPPAGSTEGH